jgi:Spy/CpxP family protein refolding chaperone
VRIVNITGNKWQLRLAALVIFLLGAAAGALAPRAYHAWFDTARAPRQARFEQMLDRLQLNPEQETQVRQVFDDTRERLSQLRKESEPQVREIRRQADERLQQTLTPEQWRQFQQLMEERRSSGRRGERGGDERRRDER